MSDDYGEGDGTLGYTGARGEMGNPPLHGYPAVIGFTIAGALLTWCVLRFVRRISSLGWRRALNTPAGRKANDEAASDVARLLAEARALKMPPHELMQIMQAVVREEITDDQATVLLRDLIGRDPS